MKFSGFSGFLIIFAAYGIGYYITTGSFFNRSINVIKCTFIGGANFELAYDPRNGDLYTYDSFSETYLPRKKVSSSSDSNLSSSRSSTIKYDSVFVGNNLKIKEVTKRYRQENLWSESTTYKENITIFDAKNRGKSNFEGIYETYSSTYGNPYGGESSRAKISCKLVK